MGVHGVAADGTPWVKFPATAKAANTLLKGGLPPQVRGLHLMLVITEGTHTYFYCWQVGRMASLVLELLRVGRSGGGFALDRFN